MAPREPSGFHRWRKPHLLQSTMLPFWLRRRPDRPTAALTSGEGVPLSRFPISSTHNLFDFFSKKRGFSMSDSRSRRKYKPHSGPNELDTASQGTAKLTLLFFPHRPAHRHQFRIWQSRTFAPSALKSDISQPVGGHPWRPLPVLGPRFFCPPRRYRTLRPPGPPVVPYDAPVPYFFRPLRVFFVQCHGHPAILNLAPIALRTWDRHRCAPVPAHKLPSTRPRSGFAESPLRTRRLERICAMPRGKSDVVRQDPQSSAHPETDLVYPSASADFQSQTGGGGTTNFQG